MGLGEVSPPLVLGREGSVQRACSSTHKASLAMVVAWIWKLWRLSITSSVLLDGAGVGRRPLALVVVGNPRDRFVFLNFLWFYFQSFQDNHFILVYLLFSHMLLLVT
jgi:hypothetical protein